MQSEQNQNESSKQEHTISAANYLEQLDAEEPTAKKPLILRWTEKTANSNHMVYVRGISREGKFYGSANIRTPNGNRGCTVDGQLASLEIEEVWKLADQLKNLPVRNLNGPNSGVVAEGPMHTPSIIHRRTLATTCPAADAAFDRMTQIVKSRILHDAPAFFD